MSNNSDLLTLLGNLGNTDASGCPAPFIGEALHPSKGGCELVMYWQQSNKWQ
jgi:hypothetical protein